MGIVVIGAVFIDIKGYSISPYIPAGRNAGKIVQTHGGVGTRLASTVIGTSENVCPRFMPEEFDLDR